jgi:hypothetical protein
MNVRIYGPYYETPGGGGSGSSGKPPASAESETDQDLAQIGDINDGAEEADGDAGDEDDSGSEEEDSSPAKRAGKGDDESEEDSEDEGEEDDAAEEESEDDEKDSKESKLEDPSTSPASYKLIKSKYPNFFKDFPQFRAAVFEYPKYTELFADVDSAREAVEKATEFDNLEGSLVGKGDPKPLLTTLSENNPKALKKIAQNFGEALRETDGQTYIELTTPIIEELLFHAANHGNKTGNKNLVLAARHLSNFVFANGGDIPDAPSRKNGDKGPSEAEVQLQEERAQHAKEKFDTALGDVIKLLMPDMNSILNNKLEGLTPFERRQIVKEAKDEVDKILMRDKSFQASLHNLWKKAGEQNYSPESKSRIKRAWLDRAKLVAPSVRNRLKQEALSSRTAGRKDSGDSEEENGKVKFKVSSEKKSFPEKGGKVPSGRQSRTLDPKKIDWKKTTDRDILDM